MPRARGEERKSEVRDQPSTQSYAVPRRTEVRGQMSEDGKGQMSDVRRRRAED